METSRNSVGNYALISIRKAPAQKCGTDTNEDEKFPIPILEIEALRTIGRLVRTIKAKIESESGIFK
jgi:hypothetical protein